MSNRVEQRALQAVDGQWLVDTLRELIAIPSTTGSAAETLAQHRVAGLMADSGGTVDLWPIDLAEVLAHEDFPGLEAPRDEAWGLVGSWGDADSASPTLVLNGHVDVVPPGELSEWRDRDPYTGGLRDGAVHGRGACDMKGGLVCNLAAVRALAAAGVQVAGRVAVHSVVGEEDGGLGTFATLQRGHGGDAAIITEPTSLAVVPACAGALTFRLRVPGRSAHASVRREGVSAVAAFAPVLEALAELEARRNRDRPPLLRHLDLPYALSIGTVRAGDWPSSVPDHLVAEGRLGVALGEEPAAARRALEGAVDAACGRDPWLRDHPVEVEWFGGQFASGWTAPDEVVVGLITGVHTDLYGAPPPLRGAPYGSDLRLYAGRGIPAVHYGPGDVRHAHAPNELVPVDDLVAVTRTLIVTILRFCGVRA